MKNNNNLYKTATTPTTTTNNNNISYITTVTISDDNNSDSSEMTFFLSFSNNTKGIKLNLPTKTVFFKLIDTDKIEKVLSTLITPSKNGMRSAITDIKTVAKSTLIDVLTGEVITTDSTSTKDTYTKANISYSFNNAQFDNNNVIKLFLSHGSNKQFQLPNNYAIANDVSNQNLINARIMGVTTNTILDNYGFKITDIRLYNNDNDNDSYFEFDIDDL